MKNARWQAPRPLPKFLRLCAEEPFRLLFPLGLAIGIIAISLWPLFFCEATTVYPAIAHARLMIEGMMSCFIFGFLGTAGPRLLSAPHFSGNELWRLIVFIGAAVTAHLFGRHACADSFYLLALLFFALSLLTRFRRRKDSPPPNFALVGLGILNSIAGATIITYCEWTNSAPTMFRLGSSFLNIGFVVLPLLGVAPFFLRRLLDSPSATEADPHRTAKFILALAVGLTIDASFVLELFRPNAAMPWLTCASAVLYLAITLPLRGSNLLASWLRISLITIPAALGLIAFLPGYRISALHILFIGSFTVAIFAVATRVVLGHSGQLALVQGRRWLFRGVLAALILAMISRFSADFVPTRNEHLIGAALCWILAALIWAGTVLPQLTVREEE